MALVIHRLAYHRTVSVKLSHSPVYQHGPFYHHEQQGSQRRPRPRWGPRAPSLIAQVGGGAATSYELKHCVMPIFTLAITKIKARSHLRRHNTTHVQGFSVVSYVAARAEPPRAPEIPPSSFSFILRL